MFPLKDTIPGETMPIINWLIILTCTLVFLFEFSLGKVSLDHFLDAYGVIPAYLSSGQDVSSIFTSMFLHGGWSHLIGNMWFLFIFGDNVEDRFGHLGYFFFYLFCGTIAALTQVFVNPHSQVAMIGASGAISGVLGAYFVFYPQARVVTMIWLGILSRLMEIPAVIFLGLWFAMQFISGASSLTLDPSADVGGVAFFAHVGGFVSGVLIALCVPRREPMRLYSHSEWI